MTKMIKLSLVAAVAVAGLSTTASASGHTKSPFEFSGFVSYTMEKTTADVGDDAEAQRDLDIRVNAKAKINNEWSTKVRVDEANDDDTDGNGAVDSDSLTMQVDRANVNYNANGTSVTFGMVGAPLTDGAQADGIIAKKKMGATTLVGGYLYTTALGSSEVAFVAAAGKAGPVGYHVAFANVMASDASIATANTANTDGDADTKVNNSTLDNTVIAIDLSAKFGMANVGLNYGSRSSSGLTGYADMDYAQTKLSVGAKLGKVNASFAYAVNADDGGKAMIDGSDAGKTNIVLGKTDLRATGDASSAMMLAVSAKVSEQGSVKVAYAAISGDLATTVEESTVLLKYSHKSTKNLGLFANYEMNSESNTATELTLGAKYSF